jgi:hypothetical protein
MNITFCNKLAFYGEELLALCPTPKLETTPCWLSATAYSIYLQLPSISGGHLSIHNPRMHHTMVMDPQSTGYKITGSQFAVVKVFQIIYL